MASHVEQCKLALAHDVLPKTRVYLDQKYWIYCRDAMLGRPSKPVHLKIYRVLRDAVQGGNAICPTSHPVLNETFKQGDRERRTATARVIDELCGNVAMEPFHVLMQLELLHFIRVTMQGSDCVHGAEEMAWTWPSWVVGLMRPDSVPLDQATSEAIARAFFDTTTHLPFSSLVESIGDDGPPTLSYDTEESQRARTEETRRHRHEFRTFEDAFLIEVGGVLEAMADHLDEAMVYLYECSAGKSPTPGEVRAYRASRPDLAGIIYSAFKCNKVGRSLPGIGIPAGIHAAIRYRGQPHRKGDLDDHLHARTALPYCDLFLTERNLGNLLTQPLLQYDTLYQCRVLWEDEDILAILEQL